MIRLTALAAITAALGSTPAIADEQTSQWIGGALGMEVGGGMSPGGLLFQGLYDSQLSQSDWLVSSASVVVGSPKARCFRDRANEFKCDHKAFDGFAADVGFAIRRQFTGRHQGFNPYAQVGVALRLVGFPDDEIRGLALPFSVGGGIIVRLSDNLRILGGADVRLGPGYFNRAHFEMQENFDLHIGLEFALD